RHSYPTRRSSDLFNIIGRMALDGNYNINRDFIDKYMVFHETRRKSFQNRHSKIRKKCYCEGNMEVGMGIMKINIFMFISMKSKDVLGNPKSKGCQIDMEE